MTLADTNELIDPSTHWMYDGFSGKNANAPGFRWSGLLSVDRSGTVYQVCPYWDQRGEGRIAVRQYGGAWTVYVYDGVFGPVTLDNHNVFNIGIDPNGYVHAIYDIHAQAIKYRKSNSPIESFGDDSTFGAQQNALVNTNNEDQVTYPTFFNGPSGDLYLLFRSGISGDGDLYFYHYDHVNTTWEAAPATGTAGLLINGETVRSPYWSGPMRFDSQGNGHLFWHWRDSDNPDDNNDVAYVKWTGSAFEQSDGTSQTIPITQANAEVADNVGTNSGLNAGFSVPDIDSQDRPHFAFWKRDQNGDIQLYHVYYDAGWTIVQVSSGTGRDRQATSNVRVFLDGNDKVHILARDNIRHDGFIAYQSTDTDYTTWSWQVVVADFVQKANPEYDPYQWDQNGRVEIPFFRLSAPAEKRGSIFGA